MTIIEEDNMWYVILIDNVAYDEPRLVVDPREEAAIVYDECIHLLQDREDYMIELNDWMGEPGGEEIMKENVIEKIESILRWEDEYEEVYGLSMMFSEDGWGRDQL